MQTFEPIEEEPRMVSQEEPRMVSQEEPPDEHSAIPERSSKAPIQSSNHPTPKITTLLGVVSTANFSTMIWRAGSRAKAEAFHNEVTGELKLHLIASYHGDFNAQRSAAYWTPQKETADRYAQWAKLKYGNVDITIIQVAEKVVNRLPLVFRGVEESSMGWTHYFTTPQQASRAWRQIIWT
ncbi:hypothetical protein MMC22_004339 [Lobaria immixta]|nr:hypothetical protein [Lobaria immixta]